MSEKKLTNRFMLVANVEARDGGAEIARGNAKVVNARLSDARYFWETDLQVAKSEGGFDKWVGKLDDVTFHAKLGSQGERVKRIMALAKELAPVVGADPAKAERAAYLAKADLQSQMVFEFPELQGKMGRRYAEEAGEDVSVARAVEEHYSPLGPSDDVPTDPVSVAVALADKLDTLVGFWAIDEKPTGSKDPYALRRAALGIIRLVLENRVRLGLLPIGMAALWKIPPERYLGPDAEHDYHLVGGKEVEDQILKPFVADLLSFFHDRLKVYLRDQGMRHDLIDAVISDPLSPLAGEMSAKQTEGGKAARSEGSPPSVGPSGSDISPARGESGASSSDDLLIVVEKVRALQKLIESEDGQNLLAGYKRAANILAAEEKKGTAIAEAVDPALFAEAEEKALFEAIGTAEADAANAVGKEDFESAMTALAKLRGPVDAFFDQVLVNAEDDKVRANRLALLARIPAATATVADFSKIGG